MSENVAGWPDSADVDSTSDAEHDDVYVGMPSCDSAWRPDSGAG